MPDVHGFDISHWNTVVDESAVPEFVLMSSKATEGGKYVDPTLAPSAKMFQRKGARYQGAYHWIRSDSTVNAQVKNFVDALKSIGWLDAAGALLEGKIIQLDWERTYLFRKDQEPVPIADPSLGMIEEWIGVVQSMFGDRVIVYGADWMTHFAAWRDRNPNVPLWYANYRLVDDDKGGKKKCAKYKADVWQWSSRGNVPGFKDRIDVNQILNLETMERVSGRVPTEIIIGGGELEEEDLERSDMPTHCWAPKGFANEFEMPGALPVTPADFEETNVRGTNFDPADPYSSLTRTFEFHKQRFWAILHRNGITREQIANGYFIRNGIELTPAEADFYRSEGIPNV